MISIISQNATNASTNVDSERENVKAAIKKQRRATLKAQHEKSEAQKYHDRTINRYISDLKERAKNASLPIRKKIQQAIDYYRAGDSTLCRRFMEAVQAGADMEAFCEKVFAELLKAKYISHNHPLDPQPEKKSKLHKIIKHSKNAFIRRAKARAHRSPRRAHFVMAKVANGDCGSSDDGGSDSSDPAGDNPHVRPFDLQIFAAFSESALNRFNNQKQTILNHLQKGHSATQEELRAKFHILQPGARICELRQEGWNISTSMQPVGTNGVSVAVYTLDLDEPRLKQATNKKNKPESHVQGCLFVFGVIF